MRLPSTLCPRPLAMRVMLALSMATAAQAAAPVATGELQLSVVGRYQTGVYDQGAAEIAGFDAATRRLFVVNGADEAVDVLDVSQPQAPVKVGTIAVAAWGASPNSVAVKNGVVAIAIEASPKTDPGVVAFVDAATLAPLSSVAVGALPDMLTWAPDGSTVLVANEGEPSDDYTVDPEGSVSIIDASDLAAPTARTASFSRWNTPAQRGNLLAAGVRLFGPNASTSQDLEPEYIAVDAGGRYAWVTLQENNAIAKIDIASARVVSVHALGTQDHSVAGNGLDASDKDGAINIAQWPVQGFYMPDAVAHFRAQGKGWLITANEGDARDYIAFKEEKRIKDLTLDPTAFPNAAALKSDAQIGRLNITTAQGDGDGDGDFDRLHSFGSRSVTIWGPGMSKAWDSGDWLEQITAAQQPANFNASSTSNTFDDRSDNKGPEPEGVAVAKLYGQSYAFVGLERAGGVVVLNVSQPQAPSFVTYFNPRNFAAAPGTPEAGDLGPEGLLVIAAKDSPTGKPMLVVSNEVSGTVTLVDIARALPAKR